MSAILVLLELEEGFVSLLKCNTTGTTTTPAINIDTTDNATILIKGVIRVFDLILSRKRSVRTTRDLD